MRDVLVLEIYQMQLTRGRGIRGKRRRINFGSLIANPVERVDWPPYSKSTLSCPH